MGKWSWMIRSFDRALSIESRLFLRKVFSMSLGQGAESKLKPAIEPIALIPWYKEAGDQFKSTCVKNESI
jgi:hypothetical protein